MLDIQRIALQRITTTLNGMGAKYAIVFDDEKFGELEVQKEKARKHVNPRRDYSQFQIREKVNAMEIGDVITFRPADGFTAEDIRSNASAHCCTKFGKKSCTSIIKDGEVQLMREA